MKEVTLVDSFITNFRTNQEFLNDQARQRIKPAVLNQLRTKAQPLTKGTEPTATNEELLKMIDDLKKVKADQNLLPIFEEFKNIINWFFLHKVIELIRQLSEPIRSDAERAAVQEQYEQSDIDITTELLAFYLMKQFTKPRP